MLTLAAISDQRYRVILLTACFLISVVISYFVLVPRTGDATDYKFMHCRTCKTEKPYDSKSSDSQCFKCKRAVMFVPTVESIHKSGPSKWRKFLVAVAVEVVVFLGFMVYLAKPRPVDDKQNYLYCNCPKCKWRLRFRDKSAGKPGQCPRCKQIFSFPAPEHADTREFPSLNTGKHEAWPEEASK